jgi:trigger factor
MAMATTDIENDEVNDALPEEKKKLDFHVKVDTPSACERHVVITIPRTEVDRYQKEAFNDIVPKAQLPGFRNGKAPRKLVESQFKDQVAEQVKSSLVMDSLQLVTDAGHFSAISEPDFDYNAVVLPPEGDFRYEFKIEVRPDFETPKWEGLSLTRPACDLTEQHVDNHLSRTLTRFMTGEPIEGEAKAGDTVTLNATFTVDGKKLSELEEESVVVRKSLMFGDAAIADFDKLVVGKKEGDKFTTLIKISETAANEDYRGKEVEAEFEINEIRRIEVSEISSKQLDDLGFESVDELRSFVRTELERQFKYHQQQAVRKQVVDQLTRDANWEMPESLIRRQTQRELQRLQLELQRNSFSPEQVSGYLNASRLNARESTIRALREHFVLEKIAEDLKVEPSPADYDEEIELIAEQSDTSPRRVRARLEKSGQMDAIRNQIIERQVIEKITEAAKVTDVPDEEFLMDRSPSSNVDFLIAGEMVDIPDAKFNNEPETLPGAPKLPDAPKAAGPAQMQE